MAKPVFKIKLINHYSGAQETLKTSDPVPILKTWLHCIPRDMLGRHTSRDGHTMADVRWNA